MAKLRKLLPRDFGFGQWEVDCNGRRCLEGWLGYFLHDSDLYYTRNDVDRHDRGMSLLLEVCRELSDVPEEEEKDMIGPWAYNDYTNSTELLAAIWNTFVVRYEEENE